MNLPGVRALRGGRARGDRRPVLVTDEDIGGGDVRERRLAKFRQNVARFRLYRLRFLQEKIYQRFALSRVTHKGELRLRDRNFEKLFKSLLEKKLKKN